MFADLQEIASLEEPRAHFLGSLVTLPTVSVPEGVAKYMLIDGQQRLTTVLIILAVIRDLAREAGNDALADEINLTLIVNQFKRDGDYQKLLPTQGDRTAFCAIVMGTSEDIDHQVWKAYRYFKSAIKAKVLSIEHVKKILCNDLSVVSIVLDPDDNPHLVFESLNAKGRALSAADLIRNYFFMRIHVDKQDLVYDKHWKPMEDVLGSNLTECIRHYLMKDGKSVRKDDVYFVLKEGVTNENATRRLTDLARFAGYYERLLHPEGELDADVRAIIQRFNRLEANTAFPFLLNCFEDYHRDHLSKADLISVFNILENFIVRRFVCNISTKHLSNIFTGLYQQAKSSSGISFLRALSLALQTKGYPRDAEFRSRLVDGKLYGNGAQALKAKLILETFESAYGHKEGVPLAGLTLEHLMPQTPTPSWKAALGKDWQETHELYLHTIGNLTLTAYNSELSNLDWNHKRSRLIDSKLELNKYFAKKERWGREDIEQRSRDLSDIAVQAWPYFGDGSVSDARSVTGMTPERLTILGQCFDVHSWRDVLENTMNVISDLEPDKFELLLNEFPRFISKQSDNLRERRQLKNGAFVEVNLSAQAIQKFCFQAIESVELSTDEWTVH